ncbi:transposable element Tcb1 transposase [Trichonephila clavipes]|nr:transposable element Tcb1 transposase [Trichonephila clavipes]
MAVYVVWRLRGDCASTAYIRYRHRGPAPGIMVWEALEYSTPASLVRIKGKLNEDRYNSDILSPVVGPSLSSRPSNTTFQQDNSRLHVARPVLIFLDGKRIRLLPCREWCPDLSPIENIWFSVAERQAHLSSPANKFDVVGHRLEAAWNELPILSSMLSSTSCLTG